MESHPLRVRGLKLSNTAIKGIPFVSHPLRVRGLKLKSLLQRRRDLRSHPLRVRGLKLPTCILSAIAHSRILYGCVD